MKALKEKLEKELSIKFKFSLDLLKFPNFLEEGTSFSFKFKCDYFRQGYFKNENNYLYMSKEGNVSLKPEKCKWIITLLGNEITLLSNGFYLDVIEDTERVKGSKHMVIWGVVLIDKNLYNFYNKSKDNNDRILSIENEEIKIIKIFPGKIVGDNETFIFYDVLEDDKNESYLSEKIGSEEDTGYLNLSSDKSS